MVECWLAVLVARKFHDPVVFDVNDALITYVFPASAVKVVLRECQSVLEGCVHDNILDVTCGVPEDADHPNIASLPVPVKPLPSDPADISVEPVVSASVALETP